MSLTTPPLQLGEAGKGRTRAELAASQRRVLMVAPELPDPPTWGTGLRIHHLARQLATRHAVRLLAYGDPVVPPADGVYERVELVRLHRPAKRVGQLASLASAHSHHLGGRRSEAMQLALERIVGDWAPDVVQIETGGMSWVRVPEGPVVVLDEHNIESELLRRIARIESAPARAAFGRVEAWKVRREELLAWERADGVTLTSAREQEAVARRLPDSWTCVVPNGVDLDAWRPADPGAADPDELVFVGSINYRPNTDAVRHLVQDILPLIRRRRPAARVTVVGQGAPDVITRLRRPGLEFTGAVADVRPHLARAAAVVVPLRIGSGTRLKILESLAIGRPVITTSVGCEGLDAVDGEHLLVADDPATFAERVLDVLSDARLRARLGAAGRELVERSYGWAHAGDILDRFHSTLHARTIGG